MADDDDIPSAKERPDDGPQRRTYGKGSSGEGALDYSPGDNEDSEGGSTGSGWRGGNPQRSQGSTGPGITAVQAPNRPK